MRAGKRRIAIGEAPIPPVGYADLKFNAMKGSPLRALSAAFNLLN